MKLSQRIRNQAQSPRLGILLLCATISATVAWVQLTGGAGSIPGSAHLTRHPDTGVELRARFSQPMIVQGEDGTLYLNLEVTTPERDVRVSHHGATDLILVLDRSGSMAEGNKWQFATQAVQSLLDRLSPLDRIGLVTFDTRGRIESPLVSAGSDSIARLRRVLEGLRPGDNTNLGEGLLLAQGLFGQSADSGRRRRVILLSDGHANHGIVQPAELNRVVSRIADRGVIVSSIGMGLGFNEVLMASLADYGMGQFSFLESLESLGNILAAELAQSRQVYADGSEFRLQLPAGVELLDAAGYPFVLEGRTAVIRTGQLLESRQKEFMLTLRVDNRRVADYRMGEMGLSYRIDGREYRQEIPAGNLQVACVAPARKEEVVESIDQQVYRKAWIRNNLGSLMKSVSNLVRQGDREQAKALLGEYRSRLDAAEEASAVRGLKDEAGNRLAELEAVVDDAFQGRDKKLKQNRAAKELYGASQKLQRVEKKNPTP